MGFVFSYWYIVLAVLIAAIIGCVVAFVTMDKQDRTIIKDFVDSMQNANEAEERSEPVKEEQATEQVNE